MDTPWIFPIPASTEGSQLQHKEKCLREVGKGAALAALYSATERTEEISFL